MNKEQRLAELSKDRAFLVNMVSTHGVVIKPGHEKQALFEIEQQINDIDWEWATLTGNWKERKRRYY